MSPARHNGLLTVCVTGIDDIPPGKVDPTLPLAFIVFAIIGASVEFVYAVVATLKIKSNLTVEG
jgi:hypothetical protein